MSTRIRDVLWVLLPKTIVAVIVVGSVIAWSTAVAQSLEDARLHNQAQQLVEQGHYAEAEQLYKRLLAINEQALGPDHNTVATVLNNLGVLYYHQGRYAEAEPLYKRSLAISEKHFGREHPALQDSVTKLPQPKF